MKSIQRLFILFVFLVSYFIVFLIHPPISKAQEIGIEYGVTNAAYKQALEKPNGVGGHLDLPITNTPGISLIDRIGFRFGGLFHTEQLSISRSPCTGLVQPGSDCTEETFDGDASITRFGAGLVIRFQSPIHNIQPEIYALGIRTNLRSNFESRESNKSLKPVNPVGESFGYEFGASLHYQFSRFLNLYGRFGIQHPNIQTCGEDGWFAFCEDRNLNQFTFGVQLRLSELWRENSEPQ